MSQDITLLNYNNYFNRIVKSEASLAAYKLLDANATTIEGVNFNPADGVYTDQIVGTSSASHNYDYLIVSEHADNSIVSRWFIIDEDRTRSGQYHLTLKRDVIIDHIDDVKNAPTFIEKGMIFSTTDPLLYNSEDMTYNQIKQSETLLKDKTGIGWVVGYIPQDAFKDTTIITKDVITAADADDTVDSITNWDYFDITNLTGSNDEIWAETNIAKKLQLKTKLHYPSGYGYPENSAKGTIQVLQGGAISSTVDTSTDPYSSWSNVVVNGSAPNPSPITSFSAAEYVANNMPNDTTLWNNVTSVLEAHSAGTSVVIKTPTIIQNILALDGTTVLDEGTQILYKVKVVNVGAGNDVNLDSGEIASQTLKSRVNTIKVNGSTNYTTNGDYDFGDITVGYNGDGYRLELTQTFLSASVVLDQNRTHVVDAQYDIFCIPYSDDYVIQYGEDLSYSYTTSKALAIGIAEEIAKDSGSGSIYDTQLLPYCPCEELFNLNTWDMERLHYITIADLPHNVVRNTTDSWVEVTGIVDQASFTSALNNYKHLYDGEHREVYNYTPDITYLRVDYSQGDIMGAIIWCTSCTRQFDIDKTISVSSNALERKVENECDIYRLCSGNYQGAFEFSAAKGYGVDGFRVDCTFKPFNPYIHVVPKLTGLYGANFADFEDARGLICNGDFSLAQMSNAWANYELQNKNYQQIFARQIDNMDFNNKFNIAEGAVSAFTGAISGGTAAGMAGKMAGLSNPFSAAIGVAGGALSAGAGIADIIIGQERYKENRSFATDMYGYQLGNIKAIPTSISKNTALTPNMKIFPFVEKYTCTDTEKQALRDKITYNGMTIMKIGTPSSYVGTGFFKGQIIRFPSLKEDNHMANAIYEEINKGVYL